MKSGVYCTSKDSSKIHNSILIDEYNKCIFSLADESKVAKTSISTMKSSGDSSQEEEKWEVGMNVRARFSEDGEYYEAVIEKILDSTYVVVRYLGYENEEAVKNKDLRPSRGEESIKEQLVLAKLGQTEEYDNDDEEEQEEEIEWKPGMHCRALYVRNNIIYEATVQEVKESTKKAVVVMAGYGLPFEVNFEDMYESIPELRVKQEKTALEHMSGKDQKFKIFPGIGISSGLLPQTAIPSVSLPQTSVPSVALPQSTTQTSNKCQTEIKLPNSFPNSSCNTSQYQGMVQPESEGDALACLISSNYLSGYYAGFYDCLKKFQTQRND